MLIRSFLRWEASSYTRSHRSSGRRICRIHHRAGLQMGGARGVYPTRQALVLRLQRMLLLQDHPIRQAVWGVFEVTVDTLIVCTVTALLTLTTGMWTTSEYETGAIAQAAFHNAFGTFGDYFVAICVFLFVFSTIVVSAFYGWRQAEFLFG